MRTKEALIDEISTVLQDELYKPLVPEGFKVLLRVEQEETESFEAALTALEEQGSLLYTGKGKCVPPEMMGLIVGEFQKNPKGFGFVLQKDRSRRDIFIHRTKMMGAMNRDLVACKIIRKEREGDRAEGEIVRILKRNTETMVCTYHKKRNFGVAVPIDRKGEDLYVKTEDSQDAATGDKVLVEIIKWSSEKERSATARVIEIIGKRGEKGLNVLSLLREQGFIEQFPEEVLKEAEQMPDSIEGENLSQRRDLRKELIFTIDGADTKDIDDAVSIVKLENSIYRLGVHIADVSHYVTEGTALDRSAYERATSVYPVDRVSPMLPRKLSNGICSLNPQVDRLALSVTMDIDGNGTVVGHDIFKSVIHSREQMTYTDVYRILEEEDSELKKRYQELVPALQMMKELALILRKKRFARGAIDFAIPEAKIILDEQDHPIEIGRRDLTIANQMIEEMMLVCNETVAEHFFWMEIPFVYRIHEEPDEEKMKQFCEFARVLGYKLMATKKMHSGELQSLLERTAGKPEERVISSVMLRTMQKAKYTNLQSGHFGLGATYYSHFTSPIRRYPDLMIHRIISEALSGRLNEERIAHYDAMLPEATLHCSERERAAEAVERESVKLKMAEYMIQHIGQEYPCIISGVAGFGMFVETEDLVEGLVPMENLRDDYYVYDEKQYALIGERTHKRYRIGDKVTAQVVRVDTASRSIEFAVDLGYNC